MVSVTSAAAFAIIALVVGWLLGVIFNPTLDGLRAEVTRLRHELAERNEILARLEQAGRVRVVWRGPAPPRDPFFGE